MSTSKNRAIEEVSGDGSEVDDINIIDANSTESIKISKFNKSKNLVQLKKSRIEFLIPTARLVFTRLR